MKRPGNGKHPTNKDGSPVTRQEPTTPPAGPAGTSRSPLADRGYTPHQFVQVWTGTGWKEGRLYEPARGTIDEYPVPGYMVGVFGETGTRFFAEDHIRHPQPAPELVVPFPVPVGAFEGAPMTATSGRGAEAGPVADVGWSADAHPYHEFVPVTGPMIDRCAVCHLSRDNAAHPPR